MTPTSRVPAVIAYLLPVIGWLYVLFFQRGNSLAVFHVRQAVGLFLFLIGAVVVWGVVAWVLAWIPYAAVLSMALFTLVIAAYIFGVVAWIMGLVHALSSRAEPLPAFGKWADRLPI